MTDFICVYFGGNQSDPWWSITARGFGSLRQAEKHGLYMMPMAGCFGFAVIAEHEDDWVLYTGYSMLPPNASVSLDDLGRYSVQPAAKLQLI